MKKCWEKHETDIGMTVLQWLSYLFIYRSIHTIRSIAVGVRTWLRFLPKFSALLFSVNVKQSLSFQGQIHHIIWTWYNLGGAALFSGKSLLLITHGKFIIFKCNWKRWMRGVLMASLPRIHSSHPSFPYSAKCSEDHMRWLTMFSIATYT